MSPVRSLPQAPLMPWCPVCRVDVDVCQCEKRQLSTKQILEPFRRYCKAMSMDGPVCPDCGILEDRCMCADEVPDFIKQPMGCVTDAPANPNKRFPVATGVVDYFPDALLEIAEVSLTGNEQHHPGAPLHWDRSKSTDEADALMRHFIKRGTRDTDGRRHSAKAAWRALALLQKEIELERQKEMRNDD